MLPFFQTILFKRRKPATIYTDNQRCVYRCISTNVVLHWPAATKTLACHNEFSCDRYLQVWEQWMKLLMKSFFVKIWLILDPMKVAKSHRNQLRRRWFQELDSAIFVCSRQYQSIGPFAEAWTLWLWLPVLLTPGFTPVSHVFLSWLRQSRKGIAHHFNMRWTRFSIMPQNGRSQRV